MSGKDTHRNTHGEVHAHDVRRGGGTGAGVYPPASAGRSCHRKETGNVHGTQACIASGVWRSGPVVEAGRDDNGVGHEKAGDEPVRFLLACPR